ncbi:hypothetical protein GOODEAATRI_026837, partial [Goodea atripinnis]
LLTHSAEEKACSAGRIVGAGADQTVSKRSGSGHWADVSQTGSSAALNTDGSDRWQGRRGP